MKTNRASEAIARQLVWLLVFQGCKQSPSEAKVTPASPQASANPTPLTTNTDAGARATSVKDAGPPPSWKSAEQPLPQDVLLAKEAPSHSLRASFRFADAPPVPRAPEINAQATEALRRKLDPTAEITLSPSRLKFVARGGFVVPNGTEIRSRLDVYGHIVIPAANTGTYRVLVPGALRAFFNEGRSDAAPVLAANLKENSTTTKRLGFNARKLEIATRVGRVTLDLAKVPESGEGGPLLCRLLLDLINAAPDTSVCGSDEVPLRAEYHWATRGVLFFEATEMKKSESSPLLVPPQGAVRSEQPFRIEEPTSFASPAEFAGLRTGPQEMTDPVLPARGSAEIVNPSDAAWSLWLDGVPVGWVPAGRTLLLPNLARGKYQLLARSFLGGDERPAAIMSVPGRFDLFGKDAEN